ncbi:MAG: protoporphyrinogen oxidase [Pirellulales bacterium]
MSDAAPAANVVERLAAGVRPRVAVVGGGIAGLAAAHRFVELAPQVQLTLFEASDRLGGVLETVHRDGFLIERSADNFITTIPSGVDLCRRVGLGDQILSTASEHRQAFVVSRGRLEKIPDGFLVMAPTRLWPLLATPILSPLGKLRLAWERFVRPRGETTDESLASFARRRMGRQTYQRLVQPLVGGIYTADPERLSVLATMPRFVEMERRHGSLIAAAWKQRGENTNEQGGSGARYSMFVAPRDGMSSLVDAIAARLPRNAVRLGTPVDRIARRDDGRWSVLSALVSARQPAVEELFDAVVVAAPAQRAAQVLEAVDAELAGELAAIEHAGAAVVALAYDRQQILHPLDGFGFVVPLVEKMKILSGSFSSVKYPGRAPDGKVLCRAFIGGACQRELLEEDDEALRRIAHEELARLIGIAGTPLLATVTRWDNTMPQYHVGHLDRVDRIDAAVARHGGLTLAGNAYRGVGVPQCIQSGQRAAEQTIAYLLTRATA